MSSNASSTTRVVPVTVQLQRKTSVEDFGDKVVNMLDEIERRVEQLRENAWSMEQEKESLLEMLGTVSMNTQMLRLGQGHREDIDAITNRLMSRCRTVDVVVNTPRNFEQEKALGQVNESIETLLGRMQNDLETSKQLCMRFLNACNPEQPDGPIDQRFQAQLIECTADDQKKIRRRLMHVISLMDRAQRTCVPQF
uniref:BAG family molecular chaperone regulator 2 n=1 Tax=Plectus sambesii TaxID=2011161 RepID=A0A914XEI9_9BILA